MKEIQMPKILSEVIIKLDEDVKQFFCLVDEFLTKANFISLDIKLNTLLSTEFASRMGIGYITKQAKEILRDYTEINKLIHDNREAIPNNNNNLTIEALGKKLYKKNKEPKIESAALRILQVRQNPNEMKKHIDWVNYVKENFERSKDPKNNKKNFSI